MPAWTWELEHYLRCAERTAEDYSNDEIEGALDESEKALKAADKPCPQLQSSLLSAPKERRKIVFAKKGKKKSRFRGNDAIRNMAKSMGLINAKVFQQSS